ncbi:hypothetical protein [Campylobacter jejuni]|uniref:hypothetical protein n=1 Tax=Campylobacter jejuni TaxID=197 RepID=UPI00119E7DB9|nr:hypothetical protein [Campylobacter jejuni]
MDKILMFIAKFFTFWIMNKKLRKKTRKNIYYYFKYPSVRSIEYNIKKNVNLIKEKIVCGQKIKIAFFVMYDSVFPGINIFEKMRKDEQFEACIIVIPDISRGVENMLYQMEKTYKNLSKKYNNVHFSYDKQKGRFIDFSSKYDMICILNPYDDMTYKFFTVFYNCKKSLIFYFDYGYVVSNWYFSNSNGHGALKYIYKYFSIINSKFIRDFEELKNMCFFGYPKMDLLNDIVKKKNNRKKIIIAPHHTVSISDGICFSNFLNYYNFFLELPKKYPQIDWVFRPHPLLFIMLEKKEIWTKTQIKKYLEDIASNENVEYQEGGDYFETFVNSDAIIHDCGSFMAEYLYVGHPACYMLKSDEENQKNYNDFARACIDVHYKAYCENDIIKFIEKVVLFNSDEMKHHRDDFFQKNIKFEFPYTSDKIIKYLKKELGI